jgi:RNA polymerase sigma factor (sigma-70 family)
MPTVLSGLVRRLTTELACDGEALTDATLLERFLDRHDEDAFALLVRRHGPMVLGVCRRLLQDSHDAEDAFQATFLVAVRKAASVRPRALFGNWLYGVAYRTALEARARIARRRSKERQVDTMPQAPQVAPENDWEPLRQLLDQELSRLPEKYRVPVVLCELEGRSRRDVARQLGLPEGTLSSRLATARKTLARRLARHHPALSGGALAALTAGASAEVSPGLARSAVQVVAGAPPQVVALAEGVLKAMLLTKLKVAGLFVLAALVTAGMGVIGLCAFAAGPDPARPAEVRDEDGPQARDDDGPKAPGKRRPRDEDNEAIRGSGKEATRELKLSDFTTVDVGDAFQVEVTPGKSFRVAITADDNVLPHVKATKDGDALKIGLDRAGRSFQDVTLKAVVTMPALEGVSASGAGKVTIGGFKSAKDCKLRASGAGRLTGDLEAQTVDLGATGAGRISLTGSAREARISGEGAGHLALGDFTIRSASVVLTGASRATIQVKNSLDYDLSGASSLKYGGEPKVGKTRATGASSVGRLRQ